MTTLNLICRNEETGREIAHQGFAPEDRARAERIMIARNRAEINARSNARWGFETETPVPVPPMTFDEFKAKHATAFSDLRAYALDDQRDADCLNPILHAKDFSALTRNAPNLYGYAPCSVFIDELYHALLTLALKS